MTANVTSEVQVMIRRAWSAAEVDAVLRGRHHVYSEEHDFFDPTADDRIYDRFDTFPQTTVHFVAELGGSIAGGVRYCIREPHVGLPVDEFYDFSPHVGPGDVLACGGMLFVTHDAERRGIATSLILTGETWATEVGATVMAGVINPTITLLFARLDYHPVAKLQHRPNGLPFVPVVKRLGQGRPAVTAATRIDLR